MHAINDREGLSTCLLTLWIGCGVGGKTGSRLIGPAKGPPSSSPDSGLLRREAGGIAVGRVIEYLRLESQSAERLEFA